MMTSDNAKNRVTIGIVHLEPNSMFEAIFDLYRDYQEDQRICTWINVPQSDRGKKLIELLTLSHREKFYLIQSSGVPNIVSVQDALKRRWKGDTLMFDLSEIRIIDESIYSALECHHNSIIGLQSDEQLNYFKPNMLVISISLPNELKTPSIKWDIRKID